MYTKEELKQQLRNVGLTGKETILIHSSMKAIGEVEGGADIVLDAWMEYFAEGLLLLPTHTWANVNAQHPVYDYRNTPSCVGLLTNLFRQREGVVRSLHPTHSLAGYGKNADRLKGSYTVEGAIIIPIFIVMLAIAMKMGLVLYNEMKADSSYEYATDMWLVDDFYNYQVLKEVVNEF